MVRISCSENYKTECYASLESYFKENGDQTLEAEESSGRLSPSLIHLCTPTAYKLIVSNVTGVRCL